MKKGGRGGGKTVSGRDYEAVTDFQVALKKVVGYTLKEESRQSGVTVFYRGQEVARMFRKSQFYAFLADHGIRWQDHLSKRLFPDDSLLVIIRETIFIIEVKYQNVAGSVDEKLQTCDFKRKQYMKLLHGLGLKVEYVYVLNDWFRHPSYRDVLDYIHSVGCHYKFGELPLSWLGLPHSRSDATAEVIST